MPVFILLSDTPEVSVQYGGGQVICSSDANPAVPSKGFADGEGFIFVVNGTQEYAPTECSDGQCVLTLEVKFDTDVRCNATNSIGTGTDTTIAIPGRVLGLLCATLVKSKTFP